LRDDVKSIVLALLLAMFGCYTAWRDGPRIFSDIFQSSAYVSAQHHELKAYKCTNWNGFIYNHCTIGYVEVATGRAGEFSDYRFGRAPSKRPSLLMHRADPAQLTTDVSLSTIINRSLFTIFIVMASGLGLLAMLAQPAGPAEPDAPAPHAANGTSRSPNIPTAPRALANAPRTFGRRPQA
jgi:hypothetical protein